MATKTKLTAKEKEAIELEKQQAEQDRAEAKRRDRITRLLLGTPPGKLLNSALASGEVFHAYLFYGPGDSLKDDAAMTFAASVLTHSDHLVIEGAEDKAVSAVSTVISSSLTAPARMLSRRKKSMRSSGGFP